MEKEQTDGHKITQKLTIQQLNAVELLIMGKTDREVADAIGVGRETICRWRLYHLGFQAALNTRRQEVWGAAADRLRSLSGRAVDILGEELDNPDHRMQAAIHVLRLAGLDKAGPPQGETDPEALLNDLARQRDCKCWTSVMSYAEREATRRELDARLAEGELPDGP